MADRNITEIKKIVYNELVGSSELVAILGSADSIYQQFPHITPKYPAVFYSVIADDTYPFDENLAESNSTETTIGIEYESEKSNTEEIDAIDDIIFKLFNGKRFANNKIIVHFCKRTFYTQYYDTDAKLWRVVTRYKFLISPK